MLDFNYTADGEAAASVSDVEIRLQPQHEQPAVVRELLPEVRELPGYAEQRRSRDSPGFPVAGEPEFEALELEHPGTIDASARTWSTSS